MSNVFSSPSSHSSPCAVHQVPSEGGGLGGADSSHQGCSPPCHPRQPAVTGAGHRISRGVTVFLLHSMQSNTCLEKKKYVASSALEGQLRA